MHFSCYGISLCLTNITVVCFTALNSGSHRFRPFSALQHVLAGLVGIITPPLIIGATLGLGDWLPYLISMSLLASGIGTFLQSNRVWGIGAGMICMQGTSFAFLGVTVAGGCG